MQSPYALLCLYAPSWALYFGPIKSYILYKTIYFQKHSLEAIPYLIFMKFSPLNAEINIVSSSYNFQIILFLLSFKN